MLIRDRVQFIFPRNREYVFAAAAIFQAFVNGYQERMAESDSGQGHKYMLHYGVDCEPGDWELLTRIGLVLVQAREVLPGWDMLVDFSDERIKAFEQSGKHLVQALCVMAGLGNQQALPVTRRVIPSQEARWAVVGGDPLTVALEAAGIARGITSDDLVDLDDDAFMGIIGVASWETYLAACYGLPVVEVVPEDRPVRWLSKWINRKYRAVSGDSLSKIEQIKAAIRNIEETVLEKS